MTPLLPEFRTLSGRLRFLPPALAVAVPYLSLATPMFALLTAAQLTLLASLLTGANTDVLTYARGALTILPVLLAAQYLTRAAARAWSRRAGPDLNEAAEHLLTRLGRLGAPVTLLLITPALLLRGQPLLTAALCATSSLLLLCGTLFALAALLRAAERNPA